MLENNGIRRQQAWRSMMLRRFLDCPNYLTGSEYQMIGGKRFCNHGKGCANITEVRLYQHVTPFTRSCRQNKAKQLDEMGQTQYTHLNNLKCDVRLVVLRVPFCYYRVSVNGVQAFPFVKNLSVPVVNYKRARAKMKIQFLDYSLVSLG